MPGLSFGFGPLEVEFWRWLFVMTRIGAALFAAPLFGSMAVAMEVRVVTAGAVAMLVCGWTGVVAPPLLFSLPGMLSVANEVLIGLALGFALQWGFAAPQLAAEAIGAGMGLSMASTIDPASGSHSAAIGQYFSVLMVILFFAAGGHLQWFALVVESYRAFPPGVMWLSPERLGMITGFGTQLFASALIIALPLVVLLFFVQLVTGMIGRAAPALNLFALGLPAALLAGLGGLIVAAPLLTDALRELVALSLGDAAAMLR